MDLTYVLTGILPATVLISVFLAAITSAFLLWLYRRATIRGMEQDSGTAALSSKLSEREKDASTSYSPITIQDLQSGMYANAPVKAQAAYSRTAQILWKTVAVYTVGGLAYAVILTIPWMVTTGGGFILTRFLWLFACYAWPSVIALGLVVALDRRESLSVVGGYFTFLIVVALYGMIRNPDLTIGDLVYFWLFANAPGTILMLAFLHRRVRAVGPLVLAFMISGVTGAFIVTEFARQSEAFLGVVAVISVLIGLGATTTYVLMHLVGFAVLGILGWLFLGYLGKRYQAKGLSDQSLTLDALWLLFSVVQTYTLAFEGWGWIFTGPVAFVTYKLVTLAGFAFLRRRTANTTNAPMLLLLRVFALGPRSERFFDAFSKWWRRSGSISLIAGPDLLTAVVEPHEFLNFVSGRLSRQFVQSHEDLEQRFIELDKRPDPDGLYRVNEFFCHADTWQMTMRRLAKECDAVLMDLRSFSSKNQGSLYELEQLLNTVDLEQVVFLVDETTDHTFLEETLRSLWKGVDIESPNRRVESPTVRFFHARDQSRRSIRCLLLTLFSKRTSANGTLSTTG